MNAETIGLLLEKTARAVYDQRGPAAIHPGQWSVLRFLDEAEPGSRTVGGVAAQLGVTHAPASRAVGALVRKKLVSVEVGSEDKRVRALSLTDAGRKLLGKDPLQRLSAAVTTLEEKEQSALRRGLERIYEGLTGEIRSGEYATRAFSGAESNKTSRIA